MDMILLDGNDIALGKPLPWPLYDREHRVIVARGGIVRDTAHLNSLLANGACRKPTVELPGAKNRGDNLSVATTQDKTKSDKPFTFDDMKLKAESRLQLEPAAQLSRESYFVKVIGFLRGASLLVTPPVGSNGTRPELKEGLKVAIRSFSGQNAFGFSCTIKRIAKSYYDYLHLSFPDHIQGTVIRKAARVRTRIISAVQNSNSAHAGEQASALISNISADGAALDTKRPLGNKGDILNLAFRINLHKIDAFMSIKGVIRAVISSETDDTINPGTTRYGIEFQDLQPNDMVILQSMIYQQIIESPHQMV